MSNVHLTIASDLELGTIIGTGVGVAGNHSPIVDIVDHTGPTTYRLKGETVSISRRHPYLWVKLADGTDRRFHPDTLVQVFPGE